nr:hypothetical protein [Paracoccus fontiphilus]
MPHLSRAVSPPAAIEGLLDGRHAQPILPGPARGQFRITLLALKARCCATDGMRFGVDEDEALRPDFPGL